MSDVADYDTDILLWSERQAALLRELKDRARDLPNELDLENVAEEIESLGRSEQATVESFLELVLVHALKAASVTRAELVAKWRTEATNFSSQARRRASPAMRSRIALDELWRDAIRQAKLSLAERDDELIPGLPTCSPMGFDDLVSKTFDFDEIVSTIAMSCVPDDRLLPT